MSDLELAIYRLKEQNLSFSIVRDGQPIFESTSSGIEDIFNVVSNCDVRGASIADKIIGRAVALLLVEGGIKAAFALNINQSAIEVLAENKIKVQYEKLMPRLESMCQFEMAVKDAKNSKDAINELRKTFNWR